MNFYVLGFMLALQSFIAGAVTEKPNIILVLADDQDVALHGMFPMKQVQQLVGAAGATFSNAFTSSPLCCPSRATLLSGMYAHNHRTRNNTLSGGCNDAHWQEQIEPHALPVLLQMGGYHTFFAGKYLNAYEGGSVPPGWNEFHGLHGNSRYYNYTLRENAENVSYTEQYLTDLLRDKALTFLRTRRTAEMEEEQPFFMMIAPHAPFTPAERHRGTFAGLKALRTPSFNRVSQSLEKHWLVASNTRMTATTLALLDIYFQQRWESLLAVDELVAAVMAQLQQQGALKNTYVVYTSDNGFHMGQFAQPYDKRQPYETDIRVPLLIRGPTVPHGVQVSAPVALIDLLPTMLEWAQLPAVPSADGQSLHAFLMNAATYDALLDQRFHRTLLVQHWGEGNDETYNAACPWQRNDHLAECDSETNCSCQDAWNNTYACLRHFRYDIDRLYCEFQDTENFVEAYDLQDDPHQITNLGYELLPIERALYSLTLANLTHCAGSTCASVII